MTRPRLLVSLAILGLCGPWPLACSDGTPAGGGPDGSRTDGGGADIAGWYTDDSGVVRVGDGGVLIGEDGGERWVCYETTCADKLLQCGDCLDNDGDGKIDWRDPECLGPCDNTEDAALIGGVGGGGGATCKVDCYFDFGNGAGNDSCVWDHVCDPLAPEANLGCAFTAADVGTKKCPAEQSATCSEFCLPFTPNGCDCFGCCTFPELAGKGEGGTDGYVWIGAMDENKQGTCTFAAILDETKCPRCTPIPGCANDCGPCEVCIGRPVPPAECFATPDGGTGSRDAGVPPSGQCPGGEQPCGLPGQAACAPTYYCVSGCCQQTIL